jgi:hypothetical protein
MSNLEKLVEGDEGFIGVDTRLNPAVLSKGLIQDGRNIRIDQFGISTRKGIKSLLGFGEFSEVGSILGTAPYVGSDGVEKIVLIVETGIYLFNPATGDISAKYSIPTGRPITGRATAIQAVNNIYILRGEAQKFLTATTASSGTGHTTITVTCSLAHGLAVGDEFAIQVTHPEQSGSFRVASVVNSLTFTYTLAIGHNGTGTATVAVGKPVLYWDGNANLKIVNMKKIDGLAANFPMTSTAIYHRNRIYCKVSRDEIAVSDFLTNNNGDWLFDRTVQQYSVNEGDGQDIVGFHPFAEDKVLVFKERSIYEMKTVNDISDPTKILAASYVETLNSEIGCVSQRSISSVGTDVYFLSQMGLYKLEPKLDAKLLTNTAPLSRPLQKYFDRINVSNVKHSVGKVYNGRFYLSVPLDNSDTNNAVFVYSLLNKQWESVDTYPANFDVENMIVMNYEKTNRLVLCDFDGSVFLSEENETDEYGDLAGTGLDLTHETVIIDGESEVTIQGVALDAEFAVEGSVFESNVIDSYVLTRAYGFNSLQDKRYNLSKVFASVDNSGSFTIVAFTRNSDSSKEIDSAVLNNSEDSIEKSPIRKVAVDLAIGIVGTSGRFNLNSVRVEATANRTDSKNKY